MVIKDYEPSYIVLTPVGRYKIYGLKEYYKHIQRIIPPPEEILYTADTDLPSEKRREIENKGGKVILVDQSEKIGMSGLMGDIYRIARSREQLRQAFLKTNAMWGFWIDSDILVPECAFNSLYEVAVKEKALMVVNGCIGGHMGNKGKIIYGLGCCLMHRRILQAGRFFVMDFGLEDENDKTYTTEDHTFLEIFSTMDGWIKKNLKHFDKAHICGNFYDVYHRIDPSMPEEPAHLENIRQQDRYILHSDSNTIHSDGNISGIVSSFDGAHGDSYSHADALHSDSCPHGDSLRSDSHTHADSPHIDAYSNSLLNK